MKEEQAERQEEEQEVPVENESVGEAEESSPAGEQAATGEVQRAEEDEEDELVEEAEEEEDLGDGVPSLVEGELIQQRGCLRGCLTPMAAILAIVLVIVMIGYAKRNALREVLLKRIIANTQRHVLGQLPEDMDENEVEDIFEKVKAALKEDRIDEEALTEAIKKYQDAMQKRPPLEQKKREIGELMAGLNSAIIVPIE